MAAELKNRRSGIALPLILIVLTGVSSFFIQIIFNSGNKKQECKYATTLFPAEIIRTDTVSEGYCEMLFLVKKDDRCDTVSYSEEFGGYASFDQIRNKNLVTGESFQYAIQKLESGDCPPLVEGLILEKY